MSLPLSSLPRPASYTSAASSSSFSTLTSSFSCSYYIYHPHLRLAADPSCLPPSQHHFLPRFSSLILPPVLPCFFAPFFMLLLLLPVLADCHPSSASCSPRPQSSPSAAVRYHPVFFWLHLFYCVLLLVYLIIYLSI